MSEKHYTRIFTTPGSMDTKIVWHELSEADACIECGEYPTLGFHLGCLYCQRPACGINCCDGAIRQYPGNILRQTTTGNV